jgi:hypothetical protein
MVKIVIVAGRPMNAPGMLQRSPPKKNATNISNGEIPRAFPAISGSKFPVRNWIAYSPATGGSRAGVVGVTLFVLRSHLSRWRVGIMWGRVLALSGGTIILVFAVALWYSDRQKNLSIISNWQKDYKSLLTDKGNVLVQNVQITRQNRQLEQQNKQLVADNSDLTDEKQNLSDGLAALFQKIDILSEQIDQLQRANEPAVITPSDLEKERKINKDLLDERARLRQELERLRTTLSSADAVSVYENDCTSVASCSAICRLERRERAIGGSCRVATEEQRASPFSPVARYYGLRQSGKLTNEYTWTCDGNQQLASALVMCRKVE